MLVLYPYNPNLITVEVIPTFEIVDVPPRPTNRVDFSWADLLRDYLSERRSFAEEK